MYTLAERVQSVSEESLKGLLKAAGMLSNSMLPGKLLSVFNRLEQAVNAEELREVICLGKQIFDELESIENYFQEVADTKSDASQDSKSSAEKRSEQYTIQIQKSKNIDISMALS